MKPLRFVPILSVALLTIGASSALAESPWSGSAHAGLVFSNVGREGGGVTTGGWLDVLHSIAPNWSAGVEGGYVKLPGVSGIPAWAGAAYSWFGRSEKDGSSLMLSASGVIRGRSSGPARVHMLAAVGYYDVATRTRISGFPDQVEYERLPGFSVALGLSRRGLVSPSFQLRWHEVIRPHNDYMDIVSFETGVHFN